MARPKNINSTIELKVPLTEHFRAALNAFAKISGYTTPNSAAEALMREALEARFGKLGRPGFFQALQDSLSEHENDLAAFTESTSRTETEN